MEEKEIEEVYNTLVCAMDSVDFARTQNSEDYIRCEKALKIITKWGRGVAEEMDLKWYNRLTHDDQHAIRKKLSDQRLKNQQEERQNRMTSGVRLSKVAREFNTPIDHIVQFLAWHKEGIEVENHPNSRLEASQYALVRETFEYNR